MSAARPQPEEARSRPRLRCCRLVERDGRVRSFHVPNVTAQTLKPIIVTHVNKASYLMTDDSPVYPGIGREFAGHGTVNHAPKNMSAPSFWHTNTVENFLFDLQARHLRLLFPRQRSASASLRRRVRFPP